jgi:hypothetical protein
VSFEDVRIGVINEGPFQPTWFYDGKAYEYRVSTPEMLKAKKPIIRWVPLKIAYEHWAVQLTSDGKLERAHDVKERDGESQMANRLAGLLPKKFYSSRDAEGNIIKDPQGRTLGAYDDDREFKDWFLNRVHFRMKRIAEYEEELVST